ncbi:MAG: MltA domain-containing protein [Saprospiraceae bacterium]
MLKFFGLLLTAILFSHCAIERASEINVSVEEQLGATSIANTVPIVTNRKISASKVITEVGQRNQRATFIAHRAKMLMTSLPTITSELKDALEIQRALIKRQKPRKTFVVNGDVYTRQDFLQVIDDLLSGKYHEQSLAPVSISRQAEVKFTGYYSPEVNVSKKKTAVYRYPLLQYPKDFEGELPSRREIESGNAFDLEKYTIAYTKHPLDVYMLQLQGSGFVKFRNGERKYLAYGGTNRYPYQSIERVASKLDSSITDLSMRALRKWVSANQKRDTITRVNPNYGFFKLSDGAARGAAGVALTPMVSVAADPDHYPIGSVLLASVPVVGKIGVFETRILLVQDTGGAVKGKRHLDLYTGVGDAALDVAEVTNDYGEVFLLTTR